MEIIGILHGSGVSIWSFQSSMKEQSTKRLPHLHPRNHKRYRATTLKELLVMFNQEMDNLLHSFITMGQYEFIAIHKRPCNNHTVSIFKRMCAEMMVFCKRKMLSHRPVQGCTQSSGCAHGVTFGDYFLLLNCVKRSSPG